MVQPPALDIQLLGAFQLTYDKTPITSVDSPRLQALLAFLLLNRAAPQSRQHLAFLFWPDSSEANARSNLRQLLFALRRALPEAERFLDADAVTLQWRAEAPFTLDVDQLEQTYADARQASRDQDRAREQSAWERMVALYRGDLLPSCYDDWITTPREHLRHRLIEGLGQLVHLLEEKRDYTAAIRYAQLLLQYDPLQEGTYQQLMRLHAHSGDRAGAANVYHTCTSVLQRELGLEPSAETQQVYSQLLRSKAVPVVQEPLLPPPAQPTNLPIPLTRFIGREQELGEIKRLIPEQRLLTLTGTGGVGKTRLALAAANDLRDLFADGVWFVDFAPLADSALVPRAVAAVLHLQENRNRALSNSIAEYVHDKNMLLVLDNCEHLIQACARLADALLQAAPRVHILATSREVLGIPGEQAWQVPSLAMPAKQDSGASRSSPVTALLEYDSVRLFVDRATMTLPTFALTPTNVTAVRQICRALDGIPLAIELAAARLKVLSPEQIAMRLTDRFRLLTNGSRLALPHHKTLRAALDWSYDLLSAPEQGFFQQVSVFAGGFTLEAVEAVCGILPAPSPDHVLDLLSLLSRLIDKSLVVVEEREGAMRYRMLETIRQYAHDKLLQSDQSECLRTRHCAFFLQMAKEAAPNLRGANQLELLNQLEIEYDNLLAAMEWSNEKGDAETCLEFGAALWYFWNVRGYWTDGRGQLAKMLVMPGTGGTRARAQALLGAGYLAFQQGDYDISQRFFEECMEICKAMKLVREMSEAFYGLGVVAQVHGDLDRAQSFFTQGVTLSREANDQWSIGAGFLNLGDLELNQDDYAQARALFEPSLVAFRKVGDKRSIAKLLGNLGLIAYYEGDYGAARPLYEEALAIRRQLRDKIGIAGQLDNLGYVAFRQGEFERAKTLFVESLILFSEIHGKRNIADVLYGLAELAGAQGDPGRAARLAGAAEALLEELGARVGAGNRAEYERGIASARALMPPAAFDLAQAEGRQLSLEQAIQYALT